MTINLDFKRAVDTKNIRLARIMLKDSLIIDPTFEEFNELLNYAEQELPYLYDEHDGTKFNFDSSHWNKDVLNDQMVDLVYNFSKERVDFLKKLCRHIYADRIVDIKMRNKHQPESQPLISKKQVGTAMIVGGTVVAIVGVATAEILVTTSGVSIAAAGGVIYYLNK